MNILSDFLSQVGDSFSRFYGTDLIGLTFILFSIYFLGKKKRWAFLLGAVGAFLIAFFGFLVGSWPTVFGNLLILVINLKGYWSWRR